VRYASVAATRAVVVAAETRGIPRDRMLAALGMRWEDLAGYEKRVPHTASVALWKVISDTSERDPLIGIRVARAIVGAGQAALFEYTVRSAPTIAGAWARLSSMLGLFFGEGFEVVTRQVGPHWEVGYRLPVHGEPPIPPSEECLVVSFLEQCRQVAPAFAPSMVCFQHAAPADPNLWRRELGCPVQFEAALYGIRISPDAFAAPIPGHDPMLAGLIETLAKPLVATPAVEPGPADPAIRVIRELLDRHAAGGAVVGEPGHEVVTVDAVARALRVSRRTLQRQLAAAGTSVRAELDRARREAALVMLRDPRATVAEIAGRLGFADPSQFTRAVRRWTGSAPTQLRKQPG
jgi:AraC-like DNA-binding protein